MAIVIPFTPRRAVLRTQAATEAPPENAAILFFTGIRYERQADAADAPPPRARRAAPAAKTVAGVKRARQPV